jgi:hypothetical protein
MKPKKPPLCKACKKAFNPRNSFQVVCGPSCAALLVKHAPEEANKAVRAMDRKWVKDKRAELKTRTDWLNLLQVTFNTFIRMRDKDKPCITCGKPLLGKYDAGHAFSVGSYPNLRFSEDNCHGQCVADNQHNHGMINEYMLNLPLRIGQERFDALIAQKNGVLKLTEIEIKELIQVYKAKIKELSKTL